MKHGFNNKRVRIAFFIIAMSILLCGYIFKRPELINADKPFIELSGSIGESIGNAQKAYANAHPEPIEKPTEESKPQSTVPKIETKPEQVNPNIAEVIWVQEEKIYIDQKTLSIEEFEDLVRSGRYEGKEVVLREDFADSATFHKILSLLGDSINYRLEVIEK